MRLAISSYASSHVMRVHSPSPRLPARFIGYSRRSGYVLIVGPLCPFAHVMKLPRFGSSALPRILTTLPSSTKPSMPHTVEQFRHTLLTDFAVR